MTSPRGWVAALLIVLLGGCASSIHRPRGDADVITQDQMLEHNFQTAYDAVEALHANWLIVRPNTLMSTQTEVQVYYDQNRLSGVTDLRSINVRNVAYIRHYDAVAATMRYGVGHSEGAILVSSSTP